MYGRLYMCRVYLLITVLVDCIGSFKSNMCPAGAAALTQWWYRCNLANLSTSNTAGAIRFNCKHWRLRLYGDILEYNSWQEVQPKRLSISMSSSTFSPVQYKCPTGDCIYTILENVIWFYAVDLHVFIGTYYHLNIDISSTMKKT